MIRLTDPRATFDAYPYRVGPMVYATVRDAMRALALAREAFGSEMLAGVTIRDRRTGQFV